MKIDRQLDELLKKQARHSDDDGDKARLKLVAQSYALAENAIAVLSDMKSQTSTIYYGKVGELLGIAHSGECHEISSIWEEEIMCRIHPDDLISKQIDELMFFHFLQSGDKKELSDYICVNNLRMCDEKGVFHNIRHKILYPDATGMYSWWSYMFHAREKNAGWRIDYFLTSDDIKEKITAAVIHSDVMGSDHCPVELDIDI